MATYQIPQFLDSGDKILGPMSVRQFGYALGSFFLCVIIYNVVFAFFGKAAGIYTFIPVIPFGLLGAYLSLGKYNGRDSDIYMYKFILYILKPRFMSYRRMPFLNDLDEKLGAWSASSIQARWSKELADKLSSKEAKISFRAEDEEHKAEDIRNLGENLDTVLASTMTEIEKEDLLEQEYKKTLQKITPIRKNQRRPAFAPPVANPNNQSLSSLKSQTRKQQETNFFTDTQKLDDN
jgi:hypothetical protein